MMLMASPLRIVGEAHAAAEAAAMHESIIQEVIAAILARSGVEFKSGASLLSVAGMVWEDIQNTSSDEVAQRIEEFKRSLNPANWNVDWNYTEQLANQMAIRVSPGIWQTICDAFNRLKTEDGSAVAGAWYDYSYVLTSPLDMTISGWFNRVTSARYSKIVINGHAYDVSNDNYSGKGVITVKVNGEIVKSSKISDGHGDYLFVSDVYFRPFYGTDVDGDMFRLDVLASTSYSGTSFIYTERFFEFPVVRDFPFSLKMSIPGEISFTGSLAYPPDNTLVKVPDLPTMDEAGTITMPDIPVLPEDYVVSDLPDTAGKVVTDLPFDVPVDIATGESVVVGTDVPDNPDNPNPPNDDLPSSGDLSLPDLIISKFPFCIPFALYDMLSLLVAEPVEPVFHVPLKIGNVVDEEIVLDFSNFSSAIEIIRWGEWAVFVVGLAYVTRTYIKW